MRKIVLWLLLLPFLAQGQKLPVVGTVDLSNYYTKKQIDSLLKIKPTDPPVQLPACENGPNIEGISKISNTSLELFFDAAGVHQISYEIRNLADQAIFKGSTDSLKSNRVLLGYNPLADGSYTLAIEGKTCKSAKVDFRKFTVKSETGETDPPIVRPPPVDNGNRKFEFILGTTGQGFEPDQQYGISGDWVESIEGFKYSWGYGITGINLWVPWDKYEPTKGVFRTDGVQKAIRFCRDRGLSLSFTFIARRQRGDGFIYEREIAKFNDGQIYYEGHPDFPGVFASWGCDRVNKEMQGAIRSLAQQLATYERGYHFALGGGHTGELLNLVKQGNDGIWYLGDVSEDNLSRFDKWVSKRGIASPGYPPIVYGPGIPWAHPDFNNPLGVEFSRFSSYNLRKHYQNFCETIKSVKNFPCLYYYAAAANQQLRATGNANLNWIAEPGDGMYSSDGDGLGGHDNKIRANAVNRGTFPDGISAVEFDPDDTSHNRENYGRNPNKCEANPDYDRFESTANVLYGNGCNIIFLAMYFCDNEARGFEPSLKRLHQKYISKDYFKPNLPTVEVEVTQKYRNSQDLTEGIDIYENFVSYTDRDFWGGVAPDQEGANTSAITGYLDNNSNAYGGNILFDIKKPGQTVLSYTKGQYNRDQQLSVMSLSKGVVGATLLALYDEGKFDFNDKVGKYLPKWSNSAVTIKQVISHTSGIPDNWDYDGEKELSYVVDRLSEKPISFTPGSQFSYSTTSYQILARIAEVVTGQSWQQVFNSRIRDKVSMGNAVFNPGNTGNPNAGYALHCTQNEYSNFAAMIRDGGKFNGQTVLSPKAISLLKSDMTGGLANWGAGMIWNGRELISESAKGCYVFIRDYFAVLFTQSTYEQTIGVNNGLREVTKTTL